MAFGEGGDAESFHHFLGQLAFLAAVPGEEGVGHCAAHHHGFGDGYGEVPVDGFELGDIAGAVAASAAASAFWGGAVVVQHLAGGDFGGAEDGAEQGGFAGAAGAEESDEVAGHNPQVDIFQHGGAAVAGGYAAQFHHRGGVRVGSVQVFQFGGMQHRGEALSGLERRRYGTAAWSGGGVSDGGLLGIDGVGGGGEDGADIHILQGAGVAAEGGQHNFHIGYGEAEVAVAGVAGLSGEVVVA